MPLYRERALICKGIRDCIIMATDGETILWECENNFSGCGRVEEVLGDDFIPDDPGLYMFEGRPHWHRYSGLDGDMDPDLSWEEATIRPAAYHEMPAMLEAHQKLKERLEKEEQEVQARADAMEKELQTELDLAEKEGRPFDPKRVRRKLDLAEPKNCLTF